MLAKFEDMDGGQPHYVDPNSVTSIVSMGLSTIINTGGNTFNAMVKATSLEVEAILSQARRLKVTSVSSPSVVIYVRPEAIDAVGTRLHGETVITVRGVAQAVQESVAEILAALGWAE